MSSRKRELAFYQDCHELTRDVVNPLCLSIPIFFLLANVDLVSSFITKRKHRSYARSVNRYLINSSADQASQTVEALEACGVPQTEIGVVALYRQQIKHLNTMLDSKDGIEVLTADKSQGRDKECIIMSLVRSNDTGHVSLPR